MRRLFDWLEKTRQIFLNPAQFIHDGKRMSRLPSRVLAEEELERVMAVPDITTPAGFRDRTIMEVFYSTGIRLERDGALEGDGYRPGGKGGTGELGEGGQRPGGAHRGKGLRVGGEVPGRSEA